MVEPTVATKREPFSTTATRGTGRDSVRQGGLRWKWVGESIYELETSSKLVSINDEK